MAKGRDTPERLDMHVGKVRQDRDADRPDAHAEADRSDADRADADWAVDSTLRGDDGDPASGEDDRDGASAAHDGADAPVPAASPRVWPWAVAVVVALAAVAAFMVARPDAPVVSAGTLFGEPSDPVPAAPTYQVARRWFRELPPDTQLAGVAIHDDLVVAQVRPVGQDGDPRSSSVLAFDRVTGEPAWTTPLAWPSQVDSRRPEPEPPVVVLVDDGEPTAVGGWAADASLTAGIVGIDPRDGSVAWTRILASPAQVRVFPDRDRATIRTIDRGLTAVDQTGGGGDVVVDLADGEDAFVATGPVVARDGGWFSLDPEPDGGPRTWAVLAADGTTELRIASVSTPAMLGDLVVTTRPATDAAAPDTGPDTAPDEAPDTAPAQVATIATATTLDGDVAWETPLPGTDPVPATDVYVAVDDIGDGTLLAGAYRQSDNEVGRLQDYVTSRIHPDGRIEELGDEPLRDRALEMGITTITVDGTARFACAADVGNPSAACPASLAMFELDGTVTARAEDLVLLRGLDTGIALPGIATSAGLVVAEPDALRLRGWDDLAPVWQVELPPGFREPVVATSDTGVVVGLQGSPPSITWLS